MLARVALRSSVVLHVLRKTTGMAALCTAFVVGAMLWRSEIVVAPPVVAVAAPTVTVTPPALVLPAPQVVVQAPPPPPPVEPPPPPVLRALTPTLDAACVMPAPAEASRPTCAWDDGFPAISADGRLIATKAPELSAGPEHNGLSIHFIDARTSRVVRDVLIATSEELFTVAEAQRAEATEQDATKRDRVFATIARRVATVQHTLDTRRFRTLRLLASVRLGYSGDEPSQPGPDPIYAEIVGTTARIIDSTARQVLWRGELGVAGPVRDESSTSDCGGWAPWSIALWWDPATRHLLADSSYRTGGCMCSDVRVESVLQLR